MNLDCRCRDSQRKSCAHYHHLSRSDLRRWPRYGGRHPCQSIAQGSLTGVQKTTLWLRIFLDYAKKIGYVGTWGPGRNIQNTIHVQDMAEIVLFVFRAALEGKAAEGAEGLCLSTYSLPGRRLTQFNLQTLLPPIQRSHGESGRRRWAM